VNKKMSFIHICLLIMAVLVFVTIVIVMIKMSVAVLLILISLMKSFAFWVVCCILVIVWFYMRRLKDRDLD